MVLSSRTNSNLLVTAGSHSGFVRGRVKKFSSRILTTLGNEK